MPFAKGADNPRQSSGHLDELWRVAVLPATIRILPSVLG